MVYFPFFSRGTNLDLKNSEDSQWFSFRLSVVQGERSGDEEERIPALLADSTRFARMVLYVALNGPFRLPNFFFALAGCLFAGYYFLSNH